MDKAGLSLPRLGSAPRSTPTQSLRAASPAHMYCSRGRLLLPACCSLPPWFVHPGCSSPPPASSLPSQGPGAASPTLPRRIQRLNPQNHHTQEPGDAGGVRAAMWPQQLTLRLGTGAATAGWKLCSWAGSARTAHSHCSPGRPAATHPAQSREVHVPWGEAWPGRPVNMSAVCPRSLYHVPRKAATGRGKATRGVGWRVEAIQAH